MNTRISKKFVLTFSILLAAIWLPLTTFANPELAITPVSESTTEEDSVGFSEIDPSEQLFVGIVASRQASHQAASAGFAETDPANSRTRNDWTSLETSRNQVRQIHVGFDETDPSTSSGQLYCLDASFEENPIQTSLGFSSGDIPGQ